MCIYIYIYIFSFIYFIIIVFFFFAVMAFGVLLRIDCLMAAVAHFATTWLIFISWGISFLVKTFSVFPHFPRQNLLISLAFPFLISPSSVRLVSPSLACFALSLLSFLPNFQVRPPFMLSFLSEFCLYLCLLSSFSFLHYPFFLLSGIVPL